MSSGSRRKVFATVNMVPYIDVMLVLLIIFMATTPLVHMGLNVDLPKADSSKIVLTEDPVIMEVDKNKKVYLQKGDRSRVAVSDGLSIRNWLEGNNVAQDDKIYIQADRSLIWQDVLDKMVILHKIGWGKITLVSEND